MVTVSVTADEINQLDIRGAIALLDALSTPSTPATASSSQDPSIQFAIDFPREPGEPRELSEIPEIRLWFIRLDARYPWLPILLDWKSGELTRYAAMLVPHQFHPTDGIQFNPEALEIWVMQKVFIAHHWLLSQGIEGHGRLKAMLQVLGYDLDDGFFTLL